MAEKFTNRIANLIPDIQRRFLKKVIDERLKGSGFIASNASVDGSPLTTYIKMPEDRARSHIYNEFMARVLIDLEALYGQSNFTSNKVGRTEMINKDQVSKYRSAIEVMRGKLQANIQIGSSDYNAIIHENFWDGKTISTMLFSGLKIDKDKVIRMCASRGYPIAYNNRGRVSSVSVAIYPEATEDDRLYLPYADISNNYIRQLSEKAGTFNPVVPPGDMLVSGTRSGYWREVILSKSQLSHTFEDNKLGGLVARMIINFNKASDLNRIDIDPFTEFPLKIIRLRYQKADALWYDAYVYPNKPIITEDDRYIVIDNLVPIKGAVALEITFLQETYRFISDLISSKSINELRMFNELMAGEYISLGIDTELFSADSTITGRSEHKGSLYDEAKEELLSGKDPRVSTMRVLGLEDGDNIKIKRYEYNLGAYSIMPQDIKYPSEEGTIWSHSINDGYGKDVYSIIEVGLDADITYPDTTSCEFFVVSDQNNKQIPIAPRGTKIWNEKIEPAATGLAEQDLWFGTSFPVVPGTLEIYRNGEEIYPDGPITWSVYTQYEPNTDPGLAEGLGFTFKGSWFGASGDVDLYTTDKFMVKYQIEHNSGIVQHRKASIISLRDEVDARIKTMFWKNGDFSVENNMIKLPTVPYIDYQNINWNKDSLIIPEITDWEYINFPFTNSSSVSETVFASFVATTQILPNNMITALDITSSQDGGAWFLNIITIGVADWSVVITNIAENKSYYTGANIPYATTTTSLHSDIAATSESIGSITIDATVLGTMGVAGWYNRFTSVAEAAGLLNDSEIRLRSEGYRDFTVLPEVMGGDVAGQTTSDELINQFTLFDDLPTYVPILVLIDGEVAIDITTYVGSVQRPFDQISGPGDYGGKWQYILVGNKIYFNESLVRLGVNNITVVHWDLASTIRLGIKMNTNRQELSSYTPSVSKYTIKIKHQR